MFQGLVQGHLWEAIILPPQMGKGRPSSTFVAVESVSKHLSSASVLELRTLEEAGGGQTGNGQATASKFKSIPA